jgi:putative sigma-54 modulation protein
VVQNLERSGGSNVQISVTGRHIDLSPELRSYAETKAGKLSRFYDRIQIVEVILNGEGHGFEAEVIVKAEHKNTFVAKDRGDDMYAAVDTVMDKIERQLRRHKERFRNRKHLAGKVRKAMEAPETESKQEDYETE